MLSKDALNVFKRNISARMILALIFCLAFLFSSEKMAKANSATLNWAAPTTNTDGSALTDLAGYNVYYGTTSGVYSTFINVGLIAGSSPTYTVNGLGNGTYYFAVTAYDTAGNESGYSNMASKTFTGTGPVISAISAGSITPSGAVISWTTDVSSTSQIAYGTTTAYGTSTTLDSTLVTSHSESLSGLQAGTTYHYQVVSADSSGDVSYSSDNTFTTAANPPPVISAVTAGNITSTSSLITWTTDVASSTQVVYGLTAAYGFTTALDATLLTSHSQSLTGLQAATTYHFQVISAGSSGNVAQSSDNTFTTASDPQSVISAIASSNISTISASISWSTNIAATSQIQYGTTAAYGLSTTLDPTLVTSHSQNLTGLQPGTTYHFEVMSSDGSGNVTVSSDNTFTTVSIPLPVVSHVSASNITSSGAVITWTTNTQTTSQVEYGTTTAYGFSTVSDPTLVTNHSQTLANLQGGTTYHYRVLSTDASGNPAISADSTFATLPSTTGTPPPGPTISSVSANNITDKSVVITWTTNIPATSQIEYGATSTYGFATSNDSNLVTVHSQTLYRLQPGTLYHFRVDSADGSGNLTLSNDFTVQTTGVPYSRKPSPPVLHHHENRNPS